MKSKLYYAWTKKIGESLHDIEFCHDFDDQKYKELGFCQNLCALMYKIFCALKGMIKAVDIHSKD